MNIQVLCRGRVISPLRGLKANVSRFQGDSSYCSLRGLGDRDREKENIVDIDVTKLVQKLDYVAFPKGEDYEFKEFTIPNSIYSEMMDWRKIPTKVFSVLWVLTSAGEVGIQIYLSDLLRITKTALPTYYRAIDFLKQEKFVKVEKLQDEPGRPNVFYIGERALELSRKTENG